MIEWWKGESPVDGAPLVALITGLDRPSNNRKTGPVIQQYILRADMPPVQAVRTGADVSICGSCEHRGQDGFKGRSCYVNVAMDPSGVWHSWRKGAARPRPDDATLYRLLRHRIVRLGTYGDPAMLPFEATWDLVRLAKGWVGYSHSMGESWCDTRYRELLMRSVSSLEEAQQAWSMGYTTFRTKVKGEPDDPSEKPCPYDTRGTQCFVCQACNTRGYNRTVEVHGTKWQVVNFERRQAA